MTKLTKDGENGITVTLDSEAYMFITIIKDGKEIATGPGLIYSLKDMPDTAVSALKGSGYACQPLSKETTDLIENAIKEYHSLPEVSLPRERFELKLEISIAYDKFTYLREQDYDNDIGFHQSPAAEKEIEIARDNLKKFDLAHPEIAAKIKKEEAEKTERQIKSALNA